MLKLQKISWLCHDSRHSIVYSMNIFTTNSSVQYYNFLKHFIVFGRWFVKQLVYSKCNSFYRVSIVRLVSVEFTIRLWFNYCDYICVL